MIFNTCHRNNVQCSAEKETVIGIIYLNNYGIILIMGHTTVGYAHAFNNGLFID